MIEDKKKRVLTENQKAFLEALAGEAKGNFRQALRIAGYAETTKVSEVVDSLREEIIETAQRKLVMESVKASVKLADLMDNPMIEGAPTIHKVTESILDRVGVSKKTEQSISELAKGKGGIVILPAKGSAEVKIYEGE